MDNSVLQAFMGITTALFGFALIIHANTRQGCTNQFFLFASGVLLTAIGIIMAAGSLSGYSLPTYLDLIVSSVTVVMIITTLLLKFTSADKRKNDEKHKRAYGETWPKKKKRGLPSDQGGIE